MPELPDVSLYLEALETRVRGTHLEQLRLLSPFVLRSVDPPVDEIEGRRVLALRRLGKRIVFELEDARFVVIHLMIAGRLQWKDKGAGAARRKGLAAFDFEAGTLTFSEAGSRKRASIHLVHGEEALAEHDPGGIDVLSSTPETFAEALQRNNHTLKRALTDPRLLSGIGNAYSDEILHRARLSPVRLTQRLDDAELRRLHDATLQVLKEWIDRLRDEAAGAFPTKVTAFRKEMAVHGKYGKPCPDCGSPVQRIRYAANETNYCAVCQNAGRLLADRALSTLMKKDWPRTLEEIEALKRR